MRIYCFTELILTHEIMMYKNKEYVENDKIFEKSRTVLGVTRVLQNFEFLNKNEKF